MTNLSDINNATWFGANIYNYIYGTSSVNEPITVAANLQGASEGSQGIASYLGYAWSEVPSLTEIALAGQNVIKDYGILTAAGTVSYIGGSWLSGYAIDYLVNPHIKAERVGAIALTVLTTSISISSGSSCEAEKWGLACLTLAGAASNVGLKLYGDYTSAKVKASATPKPVCCPQPIEP